MQTKIDIVVDTAIFSTLFIFVVGALLFPFVQEDSMLSNLIRYTIGFGTLIVAVISSIWAIIKDRRKLCPYCRQRVFKSHRVWTERDGCKAYPIPLSEIL